jgi:hypothetical protein
MAIVLAIMTAGLGAAVAGALVDRVLRHPDGPAKQAFDLSLRGLLAKWLSMFVGFGCAQILYGTITHGGSFFPTNATRSHLGLSWWF